MRRVILFFSLFFVQADTLYSTPEQTGGADTTKYRIRHILLEMSEYSGNPIVETVPKFTGGADSLSKYFSRLISSETNYKKFIIRLNFKFVIDHCGIISDVEFIGRKKPGIAKIIQDGIKQLPKWRPGTIQYKAVTTITIISVILNQGIISVDLPAVENASRLPQKNAGLAGMWIRNNANINQDTLRITTNSYFESSIDEGKRKRIFANIIEHKQESGYVKLKYRHIYENLNEIQPKSEFFYCIYSSTQRLLYISKNDSTYPNKNLLEFNATCTVWEKQK